MEKHLSSEFKQIVIHYLTAISCVLPFSLVDFWEKKVYLLKLEKAKGPFFRD